MSNNSNEYEKAELKMPASDFIYYRFRKAFLKVSEDLNKDLNCDLNASGMILLSTKDKDAEVNQVEYACFGNQFALIDIMVQTIVKTINHLTDDSENRTNMLDDVITELTAFANEYMDEEDQFVEMD